MKDCNFKVYIYCASFNHSRYIKDALDGFCMQQTDFPYVCAIKDDASTDGEPDIIRKYIEDNFETSDDVFYTEETEYANIIFARHKTNKNCFIAAVLLKYNHYSIKKSVEPYFERWRKNVPYIALCEGDDYWTDPNKLQKQVDFLESHPDYSMCFHRATVLDYIGIKSPLRCFDIKDREYTSDELFKTWTVPTASILMRKECLGYEIKGRERILCGDIIVVLSCAAMGKVWGMSDYMSVYRIQNGGITYDSAYSKTAIMRNPVHMECIRDNFPKLNRKLIDSSIAWFYYVRSQHQDDLKKCLSDMKMAIKNDKGYIKLIVNNYIYKILHIKPQ